MNSYKKLYNELKCVDKNIKSQVVWKDSLGFEHYSEILVQPTYENLPTIIKKISESKLPYVIAGGMFNSLYTKRCYSIVIQVINLKKDGSIDKEENVFISASQKMSVVVKKLTQIDERINALSGIPGTVGGAIKMNAGAFGVNIGDFVKSVYVVKNNSLVNINIDDLYFGHRCSSFTFNDFIIAGAVFGKANVHVKMVLDSIEDQKDFRKIYLEHGCPNLGSSFATKNIYSIMNNFKLYNTWDKAIEIIPIRICFKILSIISKKELSRNKRRMLFLLFIKPRSILNLLSWVSNKTLNTFCFNKQYSFEVNVKNFLLYVDLIREISGDTLKEEIQIF